MSELQQLLNAERSVLAADALRLTGCLRLQVHGESMLPAMWPGDTVEIAACGLADVQPGEIVLALREGRFFLHRLLTHHANGGFVLRGDSMPAPDPVFLSDAFRGRVVQIMRGGHLVRLPVPLRPWSRAFGLVLCYSGVARRLALRFQRWRTSEPIAPSGNLVRNHQGPR